MKKLSGIMKMVFSGLGMLTGLMSIVLGFMTMEEFYASYTKSYVTFGADFYTYSYEATANAANNVRALGDLMEISMGWLFVIAGMITLFAFGFKLFETLGSLPPKEPKAKPQYMPQQPMNPPVRPVYPPMQPQVNPNYIPPSQMPRNPEQHQ